MVHTEGWTKTQVAHLTKMLTCEAKALEGFVKEGRDNAFVLNYVVGTCIDFCNHIERGSEFYKKEWGVE